MTSKWAFQIIKPKETSKQRERHKWYPGPRPGGERHRGETGSEPGDAETGPAGRLCSQGRRRPLCKGWGPPGGRVCQHLLLDWEHWAACAEHHGHAAELWCEWHSWSSRETCHCVPSQGTQGAPPAPLGHGLLRSGAPDQEL